MTYANIPHYLYRNCRMWYVSSVEDWLGGKSWWYEGSYFLAQLKVKLSYDLVNIFLIK